MEDNFHFMLSKQKVRSKAGASRVKLMISKLVKMKVVEKAKKAFKRSKPLF